MLFDLSFNVSSLAPTLLLIGFFLAFAPYLDRRANGARLLVCLVSGLISLRYQAWRFMDTVLPFEGTAVATVWVWSVWIVELLAFLEVAIFLLIMSRGNQNGELADIREHELAERVVWPSVDVFIPTYNEGLDVLEKSIIGARALNYPNFRVWVLDDGRRDWLRDFCLAKDVGYLTRPDNADAKAGNMNNGLAHTDGELVAVFDADFVPHRNFLRRTVGFFADDRVGLVQTPQHFFNKDPVQMNLGIARDWCDEQRLFFDEMAASRDAWDAAFCCGSCSIMRRKALDAIGGIPTASITEDLLTTLAMLRKGYLTRYLNEKLSVGLAAEGLEAFFIQRARWCQGGIQTMFLPEGPFGRGIDLLRRLLFFPTSWVVQYLVRFAALVVPVVYLLTGLLPLHFTGVDELIFYQAPVLIGYALAMRWFVRGKYMPLLSTSIGFFGTFRILPTVVMSMIRPFGKPFQVTPKGGLNRISVDWITFTAIMSVAGLTSAGLILNSFQGLNILTNRQFFPVAALWAFFNLFALILASLICFDAPRKRKEERFLIDRPAKARVFAVGSPAIAEERPVRVLDMSLNGARIEFDAFSKRLHWVELLVPGVSGALAGSVTGTRAGSLTLSFYPLPEATRDSLIAFLFSGAFYTDQPEAEHRGRLWRHIWHRFVGPPAI